MLASTKEFTWAASGVGTISICRFVYPHKDAINRPSATVKACTRFHSEFLCNRSLFVMVRWIRDSKITVCIDCIDNIPDSIHHVSVPDTIRSHYIIGGTTGKIAKCTSKLNRWSYRAIGNIPIVLFVHTRSSMIMISPLLDKRKSNDPISKFFCKPSEGMILHPVCFLEVGGSKLLVDIFHLVSGASVSTNCSNSTTTRAKRSFLLFLAPLNYFCCCQRSRLDSNTYTSSAGGGNCAHARCRGLVSGADW